MHRPLCFGSRPVLGIHPCICCFHLVLQTEFTSLHQWEREYIIFEQLHNKPHFMHFRMWKQFALWRRAVRIRKTSQARWVQQQVLCMWLSHSHDSTPCVCDFSHCHNDLRESSVKHSFTCFASRQSHTQCLLMLSHIWLHGKVRKKHACSTI